MFILLPFLGRLSDLCRSLHQKKSSRPETSPGWMRGICNYKIAVTIGVKWPWSTSATGVNTDGKSRTSIIQPLMYPCLLVHTAYNLDFANGVVGLGILDQSLISLFHLLFCDNVSILGSEQRWEDDSRKGVMTKRTQTTWGTSFCLKNFP